MRSEAGAKGERKLGNRGDISPDDDGRERRMAMFGCIDEPIEGAAVTAGWSVRRRCLNGVVVSMDDVRDGIQRERQQQAYECNS